MTLHIDQTSNEWLTIESYLEARLKDLREKNDKSMSIEKTENLRGRITEVKKLLQLPTGDSAPAAKPVDYRLD